MYMVGENGLEEELEIVGLKVVKEGARPAPGMTEDEFRENALDPEVCCVTFAVAVVTIVHVGVAAVIFVVAAVVVAVVAIVSLLLCCFCCFFLHEAFPKLLKQTPPKHARCPYP